jgi:hypothetical protein
MWRLNAALSLLQFSGAIKIARGRKKFSAKKDQSGMQAITVISTRRSGEFNITSTVVLAGLFVGKNLAYSSL